MAASILCVDDDRNLCQIVGRALESEGYEVRTAFDGESAIARIRECEPDLVLLDVLLPRRDGFDVLAEIRQLGGTAAQLPVALITGCTPTPQYAQRANELRALELLTKPVALDKIIELVTRQIGEAKPTAEARKGGTRGGISGTLERIPFPAVLHHLHGLRATGVLQITSGKRRKWIQVRDGYPVAVRSNLVRETLGHMLVRSGRITKAVLEESRRRMEKHGRRQGEILVAMEVLSEQEVSRALRDQADEKLFEVFGWSEGEFVFERGASLQRANALAVDRSPANLILRGVRAGFPLERIDRYIETQGRRYVYHGESPFYRFQDLQVEPAEEALLRGLDGTRRLAEFAQCDEGLRRTLYGLLASGLLELRNTPDPEKLAARKRAASQGRPADGEQRPAPSPEAVAKPEPAGASFEELSRLATRLRAGDYFEILGVQQDAGADELRQAYERLAARTHPDRFSNESQAVRDLAADVYRMVDEAFETLSDPRRLQEYALTRKQKGRDARERDQAEKAFRAATEFRKGEAALTGRDYDIALRHFGAALELYPDEGDHHAHYGWALYLCHPGDSSIVSEALEHVRRGLKLASHREKPYLFMGRLYKAVGRDDVAEKMFNRAVHIQPDCVEALRELRLMNMRREKSKGLVRRLLRR